MRWVIALTLAVVAAGVMPARARRYKLVLRIGAEPARTLRFRVS